MLSVESRGRTEVAYALGNTDRELVHASNSDDRDTICCHNIQRVLVDGELKFHWNTRCIRWEALG